VTASKPSVGCAGAGLLGAAIMERLLQQGFPVHAWNRSEDKLAPLLERGATAATTPGELARGSDVVLTCLTDTAAVEQVVFGEDGVASAGSSSKLLVDMSTCAAGRTREMAARLRERCGMGWLDAPISGGPPAARSGSMAVMVGGSETDFERAAPLWEALAGRCTLMGPSGAGQTTKMVNQVLVSCTFAVLAEACSLAQRAGVDASRIPHALEGGRGDSRLLQEYMRKMAQSDFFLEGRIAIVMKDLDLIGELARAVGAPMPVTSLVAELHRKALADGLGERDNSELVRLYRSAD
jgi:3-hydroxyisobutyrate dehydrogenase-like beta-hydroxyacid dehydrogenase